MKIGINCTAIDPSYSGGVNSYTVGLLRGFASLDVSDRFQLYVLPKNRDFFRDFENNDKIELIEISDKNNFFKKVVRHSIALCKQKDLYKNASNFFHGNIPDTISRISDIVYTPTTILFPYNYSIPTILSMHDIQQYHYPEFFSKRELLMREVSFSLSAKYISFLQASSTFIKDDLLTHFKNLNQDQIEVIPEGVDTSIFQKVSTDDSVREKYGLPKEFLFFPAQLWPHKNHITVLKALNRIVGKYGKSIPLVLSGASDGASKEIFRYIKAEDLTQVYYLGKVPFKDLIQLYKLAKFMITGVLYESSSLCILEAAAAGTPVIASKTAPNVEMGKNLRLNLFDPLDEVALSALIMELWDDEANVAEQVSYNLDHIHQYSWSEAASKYMNLFHRVMP